MQPVFNKYLSEMVALDGTPLYVMKGLGFKWNLEFLKTANSRTAIRTGNCTRGDSTY